MKKVELSVNDENRGKRIDILTSELSGLTRSRIKHFIEKSLLTVNNLKIKSNYRTKKGDVILITFPDEAQNLLPENIPIKILHMDNFIVVVNKPPGMVVHPAAGHNSGTLMNAIAYHCSKLASVGGPLRPGVVHRLDKDTSGIIVVAIDDRAYYNLIDQFKKRIIRKKYKLITYGNFKNDSGQICSKIGRSGSDRKKMSTKIRNGKEAVTT
jgi:23S rRNA pseudouridine1911/1915/1917 synthase